MDPQRWQKVEALYHSALERASDERVMFLTEQCGSDDVLRREVESLLAQEDNPLIDHRLSEAIAALFDAEERLGAGDQLGPFRIEGEGHPPLPICRREPQLLHIGVA